jgi:peptidyl-prolyl cis-trans isomerase B (cyclophilin B)
MDQEKPVAPSKIAFINQSEKANAFEWDFGDGQTSTDSNPKHRYTQSGTYVVKLTAMQGKKLRTSEQFVNVEPPIGQMVEIQTRFGNMLVKLYEETPQHAENFIKLTEEGFYDSLLFHRVINGFMVQGGDPESKNARAGKRLGGGGPGYQIPAEFHESFIHKKGALAAARQGDAVNPEKKSSGSQFYIVQGQPTPESQLKMFERRKGMEYSDEQKEIYGSLGGTPFLDMEYTVFGEIVEGMEVLDQIASTQTDNGDRPLEDIMMHIILIK